MHSWMGHSWPESQLPKTQRQKCLRSPGGTSLPLRDEHWRPREDWPSEGSEPSQHQTRPPRLLLPQVLPAPEPPWERGPLAPSVEHHGLPACVERDVSSGSRAAACPDAGVSCALPIYPAKPSSRLVKCRRDSTVICPLTGKWADDYLR